MRFRRTASPITKRKSLHPYKNEFELGIHHTIPMFDYEDKARKVPYTTEAIYNPDFTLTTAPWLLVEAKGRFQGGSKEAAKYVWVKRCHPELEIVFIFERPSNRAYQGCRRRSDGTYLTMGEWASKNGFAFFSSKNIPQELIDGTVTREFIMRIKQQQHESYFGR